MPEVIKFMGEGIKDFSQVRNCFKANREVLAIKNEKMIIRRKEGLFQDRSIKVNLFPKDY